MKKKKTQFIVYLIFENQLNTNKMMKCIMIVTCFYVVYVNWSYPSQTNLVMWIVCSFCFSSLFFLFSFFCVLFSSFPAKKIEKLALYTYTKNRQSNNLENASKMLPFSIYRFPPLDMQLVIVVVVEYHQQPLFLFLRV